jgi:RimJ/RimL family protein N-acetyltransferase
MDLQPTLAGERLLLRPLRPEDREALYAVARDPQIWAQHPDRERWREEAFGAYFNSLLDRGGSLAVIERASGALIGVSRFQYGRPDDGGTIEIGSTMLARSHWGGDANREMKRLMVAHALRYVATVEFWVGEDNLRSRRAMEKLGARLTDRLERPEIAGRTVPHRVYAISREEFARGRLGTTGD